MEKKSAFRRLCISLLVTAVAMGLLTGFSKQVYAEKPKYGGILKNISRRCPRSIGWPSSAAGPELADYFLCMEPLLRMDGNGKPVPFLATSYKYGPDLKTLVFTIRKGVKFHDGADLNAEAVKMNLEERKKGILGREMGAVETIDVIDEYTVRLNLSEYKNSLLENFADFNGLMVSPKVIEKAKTKKGKKWAKKNPVGTGAFKFVKFERPVILKVERFDGYWQKGKPYLDGVETHYIRDPMTAVTSLRAGEAHVMWETPVAKTAELKEHGFEINYYPGAIRGLASDSANPESIYANRKIREAVEYAIDREAISGALGYGYWGPVNQYSVKQCNGYNPDLKGRPYNPEKAKQLLKEAGYPNGFKTKLMSSTKQDVKDTLAALQGYLKEVGIDAELVFYDEGKYFLALIKGHKDGLLIYGQTLRRNQTEELNGLFKKGSARLPGMFRPIELQEVLTEAEKTPDYETQTSLTQKAVRIMSDEAVVLPLWSYAVINVKHKSLRDPGYSHAWRGQWTPENAWLSE